MGHMCQEESQNSGARWAAAGNGSQSKGNLGLRFALAIKTMCLYIYITWNTGIGYNGPSPYIHLHRYVKLDVIPALIEEETNCYRSQFCEF